MNDNFFNQRKIRAANISGDLNKNGLVSNGSQISQNFSQNSIHPHQSLNHTSSNHIPPNMIPQLVNLISPQISVSQPGNQSMLNMGFNATPYLQNHLYSLPSTFGALSTMPSHRYAPGNLSYMNSMRMNNGQPAPPIVNYKDPKVNQFEKGESLGKTKVDITSTNNKISNYPVRLLVNSELVGPLIGRKGEKIKEITTHTGAKIDIKRESVPYSQFGVNNYMFSGCNRKGSGSGDGDQIVTANNHSSRGESQIVFIIGEPEKCTAAIQEIMQLCAMEASEQGREEPNLGMLAEDRFCARIIGKEGRFLNFVRCKSNSQVNVSNVPTITTLNQQPHIISLDRIISCRGGGLSSLLEAEKLISEKVRQCVEEDSQNSISQKSFSKFSKDDSFIPPRAADMSLFNQYFPLNGPQFESPFMKHEEISLPRRPHAPGFIGSGIVHRANPNWPDNLKLDENLYVRIPQICAGSIIGSEGKSVKRIMSDTGTYIQISKTNMSPIESVPAVHTYRKQTIPSSSFTKDDLNQRLVTIKGSVPSQCSALAHIFNRIKICYNQSNDGVIPHDFQDVRLWVIVRIPKIMLGRLIGKDGKVIRQLQLNSRTFLSFPRLQSDEKDLLEHSKTEVQVESKCDDRLEDDLDTDTRKPESTSHHTDALHNPDSVIFGDRNLQPLEMFGCYDSVECALLMVRRLIYSCIFTQYGPALIPGPMSAGPLVPPAGGGHLQSALLMGQLLPWQRRLADFHNPFFGPSIPTGSLPRGYGPGGPIKPAPVTKGFRRPHFNQRPRVDHQSSEDTCVDGEDHQDGDGDQEPLLELAALN